MSIAQGFPRRIGMQCFMDFRADGCSRKTLSFTRKSSKQNPRFEPSSHLRMWMSVSLSPPCNAPTSHFMPRLHSAKLLFNFWTAVNCRAPFCHVPGIIFPGLCGCPVTVGLGPVQVLFRCSSGLMSVLWPDWLVRACFGRFLSRFVSLLAILADGHHCRAMFVQM